MIRIVFARDQSTPLALLSYLVLVVMRRPAPSTTRQASPRRAKKYTVYEVDGLKPLVVRVME